MTTDGPYPELPEGVDPSDVTTFSLYTPKHGGSDRAGVIFDYRGVKVTVMWQYTDQGWQDMNLFAKAFPAMMKAVKQEKEVHDQMKNLGIELDDLLGDG